MRLSTEGFIGVWVSVAMAVTLVSSLYLVFAKPLKKGYTSNETRETREMSPMVSAPITSSTPTTSPTGDWKTYINTKYKYSIKYPKQYAPLGVDGAYHPIPAEDAAIVLFRDSPLPPSWLDPLISALEIRALKADQAEAEKRVLEEAAQDAPCAGCPAKSSILIAGKVADVYDGWGGSYTLYKSVLLKHEGVFFDLEYPSDSSYEPSISELMLSTFQFVP